MNGRYKLIISSKNLYKEVELSSTDGEIKVGTSPECTVRLRKELFFAPIELTFQRSGDEWRIICSDNLYFTIGDVRKLLTRQLVHGDELFVKYQDSDNDVFSLSFLIDFDYARKDYDIEIDVTGKNQVKIGSSQDASIQLSDTYLGKDTLVLDCTGGKCAIYDNGSKYGVFVNGVKVGKSSQLHDYDFFSIVGFSFYYKAGKIYTSSASEMKINGLTSRPVEVHSTHFKYPKFNRNTRVQYVIPEDNLEIQQAVQKPSKPKKNLIMSLVPSIVMLAMTVVLRGIIGGGGSFVIYSAVSMGLGIAMSIVSFVKENNDYKKENQERIDTYNKYIEEKKAAIEEARSNELRIRNLIYESLENSIKEVDSFGRRLFEKTQDDKDFLQVYLGRGRVESANQIVYNKQEFVDLEDPLATIPADLAEKYKYIENAPIISDFNAYKSLRAPMGVKTKNQMVYLDISDKPGAHGPHGLVAGTTGSGKSEVLQTYILSMATLYHPYEVGFVIIDFKGGGMANQFKNLPHLIGTITNIDGREINRSLLSIKAELVKRQEMFSESGVNHINDYIKLYKAGKVTKPMPHLIMIVDEFAELKQEYPDFMKELISAARIGRTLGIHLILATQKPAGVVDAQIWSNSKFKLCLKVQTKEDSNEVIKTPLAAEIVEPGRAYFQVGNNEIFDLFQSAYSGANVPEGNENSEKTYAIYERNLWGKKTLLYTNKKARSSKSAVSQLQAIVDYVNDYCSSKGIEKLPGICLPSLKDKILTDELDYTVENAAGISVPLGVFDDPEQQQQGAVELDVSKDNVYIVGSAQMGKTVMLQTLVYGLIKKYTPQQVNIYLVDCGSMVLKIFEDSAHVGGVVLSNEEEKCKNLFKMLNGMVIQRKKILSSKGVGNYAAYLEAGYTDMPMAVVVIDNMAAFNEYFPDQNEDINTLSREAQGVGISFVVTAATSNSLNYRTQANFGKKFVLNCNDTNEYSAMFGHCKATPKENAGRGLCVREKRILEYQVAMFGKSDKEAERSQELKEFIAERNAQCTTKAIKIPMIPEKLSLAETMNENVAAFRAQGVLPIGMDFGTVALTSINMATSGSLALLGDTESKDVFVSNFMKMIAQTAVFHNVEAFVVDDKSKKLKECNEYGFVREYASDAADGLALVTDFCDDAMRQLDDEEKDGSTLLLVINSADVFKKVCADKNESKRLAEVLKNAADAQVFVLLATVENQPVGFNSSEVLKVLKDERQAILFAQLSDCKMFDISGRVKPDTSFDNTMGYRFNGSTYSKIKIFD